MNPRFVGCLTGLLLSGCTTYQTPGAGVSMGELSKADEDIAAVMKRDPTAAFPARIAIARVEAPGYYTRAVLSGSMARSSNRACSS